MKMETVNALHSLINVNVQRQQNYMSVAQSTADNELKVLFNYLSSQSGEFSQELRDCVKKTDPDLSVSAYFESTDLDELEPVSTGDRKALLSSCEFREDDAKRSYDNVMEHTESLSSDLFNVMCKHRSELQKTHSTVRSLYFNI